MGQEITKQHFQHQDFQTFRQRLERETATVWRWYRENRFSRHPSLGGFELEAWLVDAAGRPAPIGEAFLSHLDRHLVCSELARFNVELNASPQTLNGRALHRMQDELARNWRVCSTVAERLGAALVMVGILPSVRLEDFHFDNMAPLNRYHALNEQTLRLRQGKPLAIDIQGRADHLQLLFDSVMLESATTSFQIHLQVAAAEAVRIYNTALILSAPMVAICANAPYLFGRDLWDETRIALFEQSVDARDLSLPTLGLQRVGFGSGYVSDSIIECFQENLDAYPPLLPMDLSGSPAPLPHLRLHNGTIWRWNRPLVGVDPDGTPHLRIEHRVVSAGPSIADMIANAALFFGMVRHYRKAETPPEARLPFAAARDNFYAAARFGLDAELLWLDGRRVTVAELLREELLPAARQGLEDLDMDPNDSDDYLGIVAARLAKRQTGAAWQRGWVARHGPDMDALTRAYLERQQSGAPVHEWGL